LWNRIESTAVLLAIVHEHDQNQWRIFMRKIALGIAALSFAAAVPVMAQETAAMAFADIDTDGDGVITLAELQVAWPDFLEEDFTAADTDASGGFSEEEYTAWWATMPNAESPADANMGGDNSATQESGDTNLSVEGTDGAAEEEALDGEVGANP
jgi:hypothetical protein